MVVNHSLKESKAHRYHSHINTISPLSPVSLKPFFSLSLIPLSSFCHCTANAKVCENINMHEVPVIVATRSDICLVLLRSSSKVAITNNAPPVTRISSNHIFAVPVGEKESIYGRKPITHTSILTNPLGSGYDGWSWQSC